MEKPGPRLIDDEGHRVTVGEQGRGSVVHLCQASENDPDLPLEPGPSGVVLAIPGDLPSECRRLQGAGVAFSQEPEKADWGWYATVRDPDGNERYLAPAPSSNPETAFRPIAPVTDAPGGRYGPDFGRAGGADRSVRTGRTRGPNTGGLSSA